MSNPAQYQRELLRFSDAFNDVDKLKRQGQLSALNNNL